MKRAFVSLAGLLGLAALWRRLARRKQSPVDRAGAAEPLPAPAAGDPAEELRRKLADARGAAPAPAAAPAANPSGSPEETLAERRARVHAKARAAIDSMAGDPVDGDPVDGDQVEADAAVDGGAPR